MKIYHYDAFTNQPDKGNPAGVVLEAEMLSENDMQNIAAAVGFNETAFIFPSTRADIQNFQELWKIRLGSGKY